jgi:putative ABC transport system ATP-binding protein
MPLLELNSINKIYNSGETEFAALKNVNLTVNEGEFTAITGASGSGKSTLMNLLGLLDSQTSGTYKFAGENVRALSERRLTALRNRSIGFIFQSFNLLPGLTAEENAELPLVYRKVPAVTRKKLVHDALEAVGIAHRASHRPSQMSGGQQQRVAIARAIAASPSLILADEPTGNLDSSAAKTVLELLFSLNERGTTVVIITHDKEIAASAKRVVTIKDGQIV